ncbi:MAG TPA: trigger factor, partial [Planctomycetes bacterium]|nr:trigger factor [Planctomycetota bacterium]
VPRPILEKKFGTALREDVKERVVDQAWREALEENDLEPLGEPKVEGLPPGPLDENQDLSFQAVFDVYPEIKLGEVKGLKVKKEKIQVSEAEVDQALDELARSRARLEPVPDAEVEREDSAKCDLEFLHEGESVKTFQDLVLSPLRPLEGTDPEEFAAKLLGRRAGEESSLFLTFPKNFPVETVREKPGEVKIQIKEVLREKVPPLDDELAKALGVEGGLEELRKKVEESLYKEKERAEKKRIEEELIDLLLAEYPFELPQAIVEEQLESRLTRAKAEMEAQGLPPEEVATKLASMKEEVRDEDIRAIKTFFLVREIAKKEKIYVTEGEVNRAVQAMAAEQRMSPEQLRSQLESRGILQEIRFDLLERKVMDYLREKAELVED